MLTITEFAQNLDKMLYFSSFRGCSYGGELTRLGGLARLGGGLARLGEISHFLRNSYKNTMCSYEK